MLDYPPVPPYHYNGAEMKYRFARSLEKKLYSGRGLLTRLTGRGAGAHTTQPSK